MYIQITSKCNMACEHCCYACGPRGRHMSMKTFHKALELCDDGTIALGGGEPTLHPQFWEMFGLALGKAEESLFIATNGTQTETAIALARLAKRGVVNAALSYDSYHDTSMVDERVLAAFRKNNTRGFGQRDEDLREIRDHDSKRISAAGRGKNLSGSVDLCPCPELTVSPSGRIYHCGCKTHSYGTVFATERLDEYWDMRSRYIECHGLEYEMQLATAQLDMAETALSA